MSTALPCTERLLTARQSAEAAGRGVMPLLAILGKPEIRLGCWDSYAGGTVAGPWQPAPITAKKAEAKPSPAAAPADSSGDEPASETPAETPADDTPKEESSDAELDALLASLDTEEKKEGEAAATEEMDPELAALLADL